MLIFWLMRSVKEKEKRENQRRQNINAIFGQNFEMRNPDLEPPTKQPYNFNSNTPRQNDTSYV